jgi:hypothetical protein
MSAEEKNLIIENVSRRNFLQGMLSTGALVICVRTSPLLAKAARNGAPTSSMTPSVDAAAFHPGVYVGSHT